MYLRTCAMIITVLLGTAGLFAQSKADIQVREGDRYFRQMAYARAIEYYAAAAELGAVNEYVTKKLAECHRFLRNTEEAERWYGILVKFLNVQPEDMYYYAEALKSNGNYKEAERWMDQYLALTGHGSTRSNITGFVRQLTQNPDRFTVRSADINTSYAEFGAAWLGDGRIAFLSSRNEPVGIERRAAMNGQPFLDLYIANSTADGALTDVRPMRGNINSRMHEGPISANVTGDVVWFTRNQPVSGAFLRTSRDVSRLGILMAAAVVGDIYDVEAELPFNNAEHSCGHPALSPDGNSLYFVSDMPGGHGGADLYVITMEAWGWSEPRNLGPSINTDRDELFPYVGADGVLYFASNGHPGLGGLDIFAAKPSGSSGFQPPINVGAPVNGPKDDFGFIIDAEGRSGYFSSNRPGGQGDDDIYAFTMHSPLEQGFLCTGQVIDDEHEIPVIAAEVELYDLDGRLLASTETDGRGEYSFPVERDRAYKLVARMKGRYDGEQFLSTEDIDQQRIITRDIHLVADAGIWMRGVVSHKGRLGFIEGMTVSVVNLSSFHADSRATNSGGAFNIRLQSNEEFEVLFEKEGFFSQSVPVTTVGMRQGIIDMNEARDLSFERIEIGTPITLRHIRWELGSAALDPIARTELDGLAERLLVNPTLVVEVSVHSDARGDGEDELFISSKRAEAITAYLANKGVPQERMVAKGYGATRLLNHCAPGVQCTEEEHAVNRRTTYTVTAIKP